MNSILRSRQKGGLLDRVNGRLKRRLKGSFTVEATLVIPIFLFVIFSAMYLGLNLYQEIEEQQEYETVAQLWEVKDFYRIQAIGEVISD